MESELNKCPLVQSFGSEKRWVMHREKQPYMTTGQRASVTDESTWGTYAEVTAKGNKLIGIILKSDKLLLGIDIDHCLENGEVSHEKRDEILRLVSEADTYTEISISGSGLHLYLALEEPLTLIANKKAPFECYIKGRHLAVTENSFGDARPVRTVSVIEAQRLLGIIGYPWKEVASANIGQSVTSIDDAVVLEKMFASKHGTRIKALYEADITHYNDDDSSADMALCGYLAAWTGKNYDQIERMWLVSPLGARKKTQTRKDYRNFTITKAITGCKWVYEWKETVLEANNLPKNTFHLWTPGEILAHDFGEEEWTVESLIPKQGMTALSGNPGDFKTWVTIHMALCISRGTPAFGKFDVTQGSVLVIDEEDHLRQLKKRLTLLGARGTDSIYYLSQNGIKVDEPAVRDAILKIVKDKNITLLILDSLVRVHGQDENDAKSMAKVFSSLQKIIEAGASILFTHHHRKQQGFVSSNPGQMMRGSSDILAAVDSHIMLEKKRDEADRLILKQPKSRQAEVLEPIEIKVLKDTVDDDGKSCPSGFEYVGGYDEKKKKAQEVADAIPLIIADGMKSRTELLEALKEEFGKTAIEDGIKIAEETCVIEKVPRNELSKGESRKAYYRLPGTAISDSVGVEDDLPASYTYIDAGKQEDAGKVVEDYEGGSSTCCASPMSENGQCLSCGADGRFVDDNSSRAL